MTDEREEMESAVLALVKAAHAAVRSARADSDDMHQKLDRLEECAESVGLYFECEDPKGDGWVGYDGQP